MTTKQIRTKIRRLEAEIARLRKMLPTYEMWMAEVEKELNTIGIGNDWLEDWPSYDNYEAGATPREGALAALRFQSCPPRELIRRLQGK